MPLTKTGKKVLKSMQKHYGKEKGTRVFYASINARKKGSGKWHNWSPMQSRANKKHPVDDIIAKFKRAKR